MPVYDTKLDWDFNMYHVPFDGRYTVMSVLRSPSKSPARDVSDAGGDGGGGSLTAPVKIAPGKVRSVPKPHRLVHGVPVLDGTICQSPVAGWNIATSVFPSPS